MSILFASRAKEGSGICRVLCRALSRRADFMVWGGFRMDQDTQFGLALCYFKTWRVSDNHGKFW